MPTTRTAPRRWRFGQALATAFPFAFAYAFAFAWISTLTLFLALAVGRTAADEAELQTQAEFHAQLAKDRNRPLMERVEAALEASGLWDQGARESQDAERRRRRWLDAADLLEQFNRETPKHPQARLFLARSQIYRWAVADSWIWQWRLNPDDVRAKAEAKAILDGIVRRLDAAKTKMIGADSDLPAQIIRYRLAQALADRASLREKGQTAETKADREAVLLHLNHPFSDQDLRGHAHALRAQALTKLSRGYEALQELEKAEGVKSTIAPQELLEAKVEAYSSLQQFESAYQAIQNADRAPASVRDRLRVEVSRLRYPTTISDRARNNLASEMLKRTSELRSTDFAQGRLALLALAKTLDAPPAPAGESHLSLLADGKMLLKDWSGAATLLARAAETADQGNRAGQAADFRLQSAAAWTRAGDYAQAEAVLTKLLEKPGPNGPKAGMLLALARGQAVAARRPGATLERYEQSLRDQIRRFPGDPTAQEARWLLGRLRWSARSYDEAIALWKEVEIESPRWIDASRGLIEAWLRKVERLQVNGTKEELDQAVEDARKFLNESRNLARNPYDRAIFAIGLIRLDLSPGIVQAEQARLECDRILKGQSAPEQQAAASRWKAVVLLSLNRDREAEELAQSTFATAKGTDLFEIARLLDHTANSTASDLQRRRVGAMLGQITERILKGSNELSDEERAESQVRRARCLTHLGNYGEAKDLLNGLKRKPEEMADPLLDDLAEAFMLVNNYGRAAEVHNVRMKRAARGSPDWLDARYGLAFSLQRSGRESEARKIAESTALVYPNLGGGKLQVKFERLRRSLGTGD